MRRWRARFAIGDQVNSEKKSEPAHVANQGVLLLQGAQVADPLRANGQRVLLQILVAQEIRSIILRHQDQKSSLMSAYRDASSEGKQFIEVTVGDVDKNLLATIRSSGGGR